eukprot:scaffold288593_cov32-Tisochrysis_lutea.AAC.3
MAAPRMSSEFGQARPGVHERWCAKSRVISACRAAGKGDRCLGGDGGCGHATLRGIYLIPVSMRQPWPSPCKHREPSPGVSPPTPAPAQPAYPAPQPHMRA